MDISINDMDIDVDSIAKEVFENSFEAVDLSYIDTDNFKEEPARKGKNMEILRKWYEHTSAGEWNEYYAQKEDHHMNRNAENESGDSIWNSSECGNDENHSINERQGINNEMTCDYVDDGKVYCVCRRPYNNEAMVACDSEDCKNEWFHLACVGLPLSWSSQENWLCPECRES